MSRRLPAPRKELGKGPGWSLLGVRAPAVSNLKQASLTLVCPEGI